MQVEQVGIWTEDISPIKHTAFSEQWIWQQLFTGEDLGVQQDAATTGQCLGYDTSFLRELFFQRLPHNVQMVLASTPDATTLDKLAEMAYKIWGSHSICYISDSTTHL